MTEPLNVFGVAVEGDPDAPPVEAPEPGAEVIERHPAAECGQAAGEVLPAATGYACGRVEPSGYGVR